MASVGPTMVIWVATRDKELVGYLSVEDFCAMTGYPFPANGRGLRNGVEVHRTAEYIFGVVRTSKYRPTLQWCKEQQRLEPVQVTAT
jgi:hypothetical protein